MFFEVVNFFSYKQGLSEKIGTCWIRFIKTKTPTGSIKRKKYAFRRCGDLLPESKKRFTKKKFDQREE
jgi:hypothetical protein